MSECWECNLPDPYGGDGDGIGSCRCPRAACGCSPTDVELDLCRHGDDELPDWPDDDPPRPVATINVKGERP